MRYLVAVSGGIDSVVLLDMLVSEGKHELTVAHFDHGIRPDSADDARFVEALAKKYNLPFVTKREELGAGASEELARIRRYGFLRAEAQRLSATIATAHHRDDVVESIAINLTRGTGWRGLAVLTASDVVRPLIHLSKIYLRAYARVKRLEWSEDSTNMTPSYLRNRIRAKLARQLTDHDRYRLFELWRRQVLLKRAIDHQTSLLIKNEDAYSRYDLIMVDDASACELLRAIIVTKTGSSPTRPQLYQALIALKTSRAGTRFEIGTGVTLHFRERTFIVKRGEKML